VKEEASITLRRGRTVPRVYVLSGEISPLEAYESGEGAGFGETIQ